MQYTRLYTGDDGHSYFEDVSVPLLDRGNIGAISEGFDVGQLMFRENEPGYDYDFHNAPARQFIILLDGEIEIETSRGEKRIFKGGDVLLVEDTDGRGHKTRHTKHQKRRSIFIPLNKSHD
ncbi:MAG: hypothetical protein J5I98_33990 [Phaeodactylibacter sp.]|nr:hypothetical protein [Phaeodactylibacter sp.]